MNSAPRRRTSNPPDETPSRRNFLGGGMMLAGGAIVGGNLSVARTAHACGTGKIRVGLIGCGTRGTVAASQALRTAGGDVELVAMGDVFRDNLQKSYRTLKGDHGDQVAVHDTRFVGFDAYRKVLESDADVVMLATPPGFRPQHFEAAVQAGKHVFMEKPVATDAPGVRRVLAAGALARERGLAVAVGLQRRHDRRYRECVERVREGAIGELIFGRAYWNGGGVWVRKRTRGQSELEYQLRNWYYFSWLGGDHIGEQHIHNLDVMNWLTGSHPVEAQGQGGRQVRTGGEFGQIFDHHMVEYTYADGFKLFGQCRHMKGCWNNISEHAHGTLGTADIGLGLIRDRQGAVSWRSETKESKGRGWQQEQDDFFAALRRGDLPNETEYGAQSTMTAILGRLATYSGKVVKWDEAFHSPLRLATTDSLFSLSDPAPVEPNAEGRYEVPIPGSKSRLV